MISVEASPDDEELDCSLTENINSDFGQKRNKFVVRRCPGCHVHHFPLPKFCRWWETRITLKKQKQTGSLPYDIQLIKDCIEMLEGKLNGETLYQMNECMNRFFDRSEDSCHPNEFPDLFKLKLRGGGSNHKVAIMSKNRMLDCVLSLLRDMVALW